MQGRLQGGSRSGKLASSSGVREVSTTCIVGPLGRSLPSCMSCSLLVPRPVPAPNLLDNSCSRELSCSVWGPRPTFRGYETMMTTTRDGLGQNAGIGPDPGRHPACLICAVYVFLQETLRGYDSRAHYYMVNPSLVPWTGQQLPWRSPAEELGQP